MKPIKQRNNFECGPVAIRNAMVLLGIKHIGVTTLRKWCKTTKDGTENEDMLRAICKAIEPHKRTPIVLTRCAYLNALEPEGFSLEVWLKELGSVLILGYNAGDEGHYTVISHDGKNYLAHNWAPDKLIETGSHRDCVPTAVITHQWLAAKLKQKDAEIYLL